MDLGGEWLIRFFFLEPERGQTKDSSLVGDEEKFGSVTRPAKLYSTTWAAFGGCRDNQSKEVDREQACSGSGSV